jgi:hypothetical protein
MLGASRRYEAAPGRQTPAVTHALWICACVTEDDAPTWLIHDAADGDDLAWCRVPNGVEPFDIVRARYTAGDHADPSDVLRWLQGDRSGPWTGDGHSGDAVVLDVLRDKLRSK